MDDIIAAYMNRDEALKFIKKYRRGRQCYIRGGTFLYTRTPDDEGKNGRGYEGTCLVPVGAKVAMRYVHDIIGDVFNERGCRLRIAISSGCLFVG